MSRSAQDRVRGQTRYVADEVPEGAWVGGALRSTLPRARLLRIERDPAFDWSRVVVVEAAQLPAAKHVAMIAADWPILVERETHHVGEPLALVGAPDPHTLSEALAALRPVLEEREPELDFESSERTLHTLSIQKGDAAAALARAAHVFEGVYRTGSQEQMYIEPQGIVALPPDSEGVFGVRGSMQCPFYVRRALAEAFGAAPDQAVAEQCATGGGFGGKEDYPSLLAIHASLLARAARRPVAMIHDRHTDLVVTPKRHPSRVRHRTGFDAEGRLVAQQIEVLLDGGAYTTLSPVVLSRACIHAGGAYACEHVSIQGRVAATDHVPYGAFRGFGAPQVCFAAERMMDRAAHALGIHPVELRRRNMLRVGLRTATGQLLEESVGSVEVLERACARTGVDAHPWRAQPKPSEDARVRRGVGLSFFFHGAGFTGSGEADMQAKVIVELMQRGPDSIACEVRASSTEFGQGTLELLRKIASDSLGCAPSDVLLAQPSTQWVPDSGPTVASRTCMIVGACVAKACRALRARVEASQGGEGAFAARAHAHLETCAERSDQEEVVYASPPDLEWDERTYEGDAYPAYGWAVDVAEVEVDLDTFEVRTTRFLSAVDVGKAIHPKLVEGQIEGGSLQAVGFAHLEVVTTENGRFLQDRMASCIIPTALDAPAFEIELIEIPFSHGPMGAKGVGELPMDGGAPAVVSAIEDALGLHVECVPATPEHLAQLWCAAHPEDAL